MKKVRNNKIFKMFVDNLQSMVGYANAGYLIAMLGDTFQKFLDEGHKDVRSFEMCINGITTLKLNFETKSYEDVK